MASAPSGVSTRASVGRHPCRDHGRSRPIRGPGSPGSRTRAPRQHLRRPRLGRGVQTRPLEGRCQETSPQRGRQEHQRPAANVRAEAASGSSAKRSLEPADRAQKRGWRSPAGWRRSGTGCAPSSLPGTRSAGPRTCSCNAVRSRVGPPRNREPRSAIGWPARAVIMRGHGARIFLAQSLAHSMRSSACSRRAAPACTGPSRNSRKIHGSAEGCRTIRRGTGKDGASCGPR
jgi:hypothetical protein